MTVGNVYPMQYSYSYWQEPYHKQDDQQPTLCHLFEFYSKLYFTARNLLPAKRLAVNSELRFAIMIAVPIALM